MTESGNELNRNVEYLEETEELDDLQNKASEYPPRNMLLSSLKGTVPHPNNPYI